MVIGGTFRDVAVRAASTRDIDIVLIDQQELPVTLMREAGFRRVPGARHAWRYRVGGRNVDLEVAAVASSAEAAGPFSVAFQHARTAVIEGTEVPVPRIEDYVILKLLAAAADPAPSRTRSGRRAVCRRGLLRGVHWCLVNPALARPVA